MAGRLRPPSLRLVPHFLDKAFSPYEQIEFVRQHALRKRAASVRAYEARLSDRCNRIDRGLRFRLAGTMPVNPDLQPMHIIVRQGCDTGRISVKINVVLVLLDCFH